ncbi:MAG TPA: DVU0150 family protein [Bryobacteraceae bacterium]|nr:DVU0150 family protein [Bryobacteraceae bacterium]
MRNSIRKSIIGGLLLLSLAEGKSSEVVLVADSRHLAGVKAWIANLFNESHVYFMLLTIVAIPVAGVILGTIADLLMRLIGINLKSRALREG